jgi:membrane protein implicated in regulation of membrane protease activity
MLFLLALLLLLILPSPWGLVALLACAVFGVGEVAYWQRRMRGQRVQTGAENLVGATGEVTEPCDPSGQVRVLGELWQAQSSSPLPRRAPVRVVALKGLTVEVEAVDDIPVAPEPAES